MINCPSCGAPIEETLNKCPYCDTIIKEVFDSTSSNIQNKTLRNQCSALLKEGEVLEAVKIYRMTTGKNYSSAKSYINQVMVEDKITFPKPGYIEMYKMAVRHQKLEFKYPVFCKYCKEKLSLFWLILRYK